MKGPHLGRTLEWWSWAQTKFYIRPDPYTERQKGETINGVIGSCSLIEARSSHNNQLTWSKRIWQQSGVKCCRVAKVLLSIFSRLHWTASRAFCSASSLPVSPPPAGFLEEVWGGRCALGSGPGGNASPFFTWTFPESQNINNVQFRCCFSF